MTWNPRLVLLGAAATIAMAAGVGGAAAEDGPFSICVVHNSADHPSITAIVNGMNDEGKLYGAEITYFDPAFDPQKQASMVEDCIARKPSVLVVNAVDDAVLKHVRETAWRWCQIAMGLSETSTGHLTGRTQLLRGNVAFKLREVSGVGVALVDVTTTR